MSPSRVPVSIAVAVVLSLALSGCLGGDEVSAPPEDQEDATTTPSTGAIEGTVSSELFEPLDAMIRLYDKDRDEVLRETNADKQGEFAMGDVEPGEYVIQARHTGYASNVRGLTVEGDEVTRVEFRLDLLRSDDPYFIEEEIRGRIHTYGYCVSPAGQTIACGGGTFPFVPWENARGSLEKWVDNETRTILVEMEWSPAGVLGEHLSIRVACDDAWDDDSNSYDTGHPCYFRQHGTSPNIIRTDYEHAEENDYDMDQMWTWQTGSGYGMLGTFPLVGVDLGASYEQTYTIYMTYAQREAAPEGFTRLGDE